MVLNSFSAAGFCLLFAADQLSLRGRRGLASFLGRAGYVLLAAYFIHFAFAPSPAWPFGGAAGPADPGWKPGPAARAAGIAAAGASALLLLWSVFFEFAWARRRRRLAPGALWDSGSYGLCRHPGFWWLAFLTLSLAALRGFGPYLVSALVAMGLDFILVFVQDRFVFPGLFEGYRDYRRRVPFLLPRPRRRSSAPPGTGASGTSGRRA